VVLLRSYIFTDHERKILREWFRSGKESEGIRVIFTRIRKFERLREDVEIYQSVRERVMG
jgi:hypothetical protein